MKLTKEDVIPKWLWRTLREAHKLRGPMDLSFNGTTIRSAERLPVRYGGICEQCNNGWMHDLEAAARAVMIPAITGAAIHPGHELVLDHGAQTVLATWALKTWLLWSPAMHYASGNSVRSPSGLRWIYEHGEPPTDSSVYVYVTTAIRKTGTVIGMNLTHMSEASTGKAGARVLMTFSRLGLSLMMPLDRNGIITVPDAELSRALVQIWPHQLAKVRWPTARVLSETSIARYFPGIIDF